MDGEIGIEWIKQFDKAMRAKTEEGEYRLLIVDGHNSHYTVDFLWYAWENQIIVICYPVHGTHLYQGLDVVVFAVLKHYLSQEQDKWFKETGQPIDKTNFLSILSMAYMKALTPDLIKTAFWKTGIHPFNPDVITLAMLVTSKDTSKDAHLPALAAVDPDLAAAVHILADMLQQLRLANANSTDPNPAPSAPSAPPAVPSNSEVAEIAPPVGAGPSRSRVTRSSTRSTT